MKALPMEIRMIATRFAALAATLLFTGSALAADAPSANSHGARQIVRDKSAEVAQAGSTTVAPGNPGLGRQAIVSDAGLGILERHFLLRAGIAY
jgi:ABC-type phosphate transport system substrate-binding protein